MLHRLVNSHMMWGKVNLRRTAKVGGVAGIGLYITTYFYLVVKILTDALLYVGFDSRKMPAKQ